jgi:signal transduction histidine kinase
VLTIAHARLLRRSQDAAVLEERARVARDLHDSVTRSLFSMGMLARAAQLQYERHDARLYGTLNRIASLAQDSLVETRALLFELHPASLMEKGLVQA